MPASTKDAVWLADSSDPLQLSPNKSCRNRKAVCHRPNAADEVLSQWRLISRDVYSSKENMENPKLWGKIQRQLGQNSNDSRNTLQF